MLVRQASTAARPFSSARAVPRQVGLAARPTVTATALPDALLFDCDGVLVDTEKDGHRISFNQAFKRKGEALCKMRLTSLRTKWAMRALHAPRHHTSDIILRFSFGSSRPEA